MEGNSPEHEWQTVSYKKSKRNKQPPQDDVITTPGNDVEHVTVKKKKKKSKRKTVIEPLEDVITGADDVIIPEKKKKKKSKKVISVSEAALKINAFDLSVYLACITDEMKADVRMMRFSFLDYFGGVFGSVNSLQFPWINILKQASSVNNMIHIPLSDISEDVLGTSADWLNNQPVDALQAFVLWCLDSIFTNLALHQAATKGSKKLVQQPPSKSQVSKFVVLAIVLRCKPDVLIGLLPTIKEDPKYQGTDKLPVLLWTITQACQRDLVVGLFLWVHLLLPILCSKSGCNPQSRHLILQLVERILSFPKARTILVNGAVRKGERVMPPSALELLMGSTFPAPTARVKATERFEAVYPLLKEVALAVTPDSKAMKQLTQQLLPIAAKAAGDGNSALASEAINIFVWCLSQSLDCYKQWDDIYVDNLEASVIVLKQLSDEWKVHAVKHSSLYTLDAALKSFRDKNEKALASGNSDITSDVLLKEADKHCKVMLSKFSRGHGCLKATGFLAVTMAVGVALIIKDPQVLYLKELVDFNLARAFTSFSLKL